MAFFIEIYIFLSYNTGMNKFNGINTSLCYIEQNGKYLMLHRVKKLNDINKDKWVGIGGKFELNESPFDCARREILEETGALPINLSYRGVVTFISDQFGSEYMHLFTASGLEGQVDYDCDEGELVWVDKKDIPLLPIWQGDKIFLKLLDEETRFFSLKLIYSGDQLVDYSLEF